MLAVESPSPAPHPHASLLKRSSTIWRRLSQRHRSKTPPEPPTSTTSSQTSSQNSTQIPTPPPPDSLPQVPTRHISHRLQKRSTEPTPPPFKKTMITHLARIDVPGPTLKHSRGERQLRPSTASTPTSSQPSPQTKELGQPQRVLATTMRTLPFPPSTTSNPIHTSPWEIFLTPRQVHALYIGFAPRSLSDKWFIYSQGPDHSGKLKVHFHRSWTGMKLAELFVVVDLKGEGAGKIVGIKWNGGPDTNWMDGEEARYLVSTTCAWVLGVNVEKELSI